MTSRLAVIAATLLAAVVSLSLGGSEPGPSLRATAGGSMQLSNSRDGQAVLTAAGLRPGASASGTLALRNLAAVPQRLTLSTTGLEDVPGAGGGALSAWLDLRVEHGGDVVYAGKLADLSSLDLGELGAGSEAPFRFVVTLPELGAAVDSAYAGSSVEVAWSWRGDADVDPAGPPVVAPDPPSSPPADEVRPDPVPPAPSIDELVGPAPARGSAVRLWLGGRATQRLGAALDLSAACRPGCALRAAAKVKVGARWRSLGRRSLGRVAPSAPPTALRFRLSALQQRSLRATLRRRGPLVVRISVSAAAAGHESVTKVRTLRLRP